MGTILADLLSSFINDNDSPKLPRIILVILIVGFIAFVGITVGINSHEPIGYLVGFVPSIAIMILGAYWIVRICKNKK